MAQKPSTNIRLTNLTWHEVIRIKKETIKDFIDELESKMEDSTLHEEDGSEHPILVIKEKEFGELKHK